MLHCAYTPLRASEQGGCLHALLLNALLHYTALYCCPFAFRSSAAHTLSFHFVWTLDAFENLLRVLFDCVSVCISAPTITGASSSLVSRRIQQMAPSPGFHITPSRTLTATRTRTARSATPCAALWRGAARLLAAATATCRQPTQWCARVHSLISTYHTPMAARTHARRCL